MIHQVNGSLAVFHPDVHVQPENQVRPRYQLHVFHNVLVALVGRNLLHAPVRKGMGCRRAQAQPIFPCQCDHVATKLFDLFFRLLDVAAHRRPDLDHRGVHLRLNFFFQYQLSFFDDFRVNVRAQVSGLRIYGLIFLFNSDGKIRQHKNRPAGRNSIAIPRKIGCQNQDFGRHLWSVERVAPSCPGVIPLKFKPLCPAAATPIPLKAPLF